MPNSRIRVLVAALLGAAAAATPLSAQAGAEEPAGYEREVFRYDRGGRADPFRSLLREAEVGVRFEDLSLRGVVHHADPSRSVALIARAGTERRIRARVGDRIGGLRVAAIGPNSVDIVVEELGVSRRERLEIRRETERDSS